MGDTVTYTAPPSLAQVPGLKFWLDARRAGRLRRGRRLFTDSFYSGHWQSLNGHVADTGQVWRTTDRSAIWWMVRNQQAIDIEDDMNVGYAVVNSGASDYIYTLGAPDCVIWRAPGIDPSHPNDDLRCLHWWPDGRVYVGTVWRADEQVVPVRGSAPNYVAGQQLIVRSEGDMHWLYVDGDERYVFQCAYGQTNKFVGLAEYIYSTSHHTLQVGTITVDALPSNDPLSDGDHVEMWPDMVAKNRTALVPDASVGPRLRTRNDHVLTHKQATFVGADFMPRDQGLVGTTWSDGWYTPSTSVGMDGYGTFYVNQINGSATVAAIDLDLVPDEVYWVRMDVQINGPLPDGGYQTTPWQTSWDLTHQDHHGTDGHRATVYNVIQTASTMSNPFTVPLTTEGAHPNAAWGLSRPMVKRQRWTPGGTGHPINLLDHDFSIAKVTEGVWTANNGAEAHVDIGPDGEPVIRFMYSDQDAVMQLAVTKSGYKATGSGATVFLGHAKVRAVNGDNQAMKMRLLARLANGDWYHNVESDYFRPSSSAWTDVWFPIETGDDWNGTIELQFIGGNDPGAHAQFQIKEFGIFPIPEWEAPTDVGEGPVVQFDGSWRDIGIQTPQHIAVPAGGYVDEWHHILNSGGDSYERWRLIGSFALPQDVPVGGLQATCNIPVESGGNGNDFVVAYKPSDVTDDGGNWWGYWSQVTASDGPEAGPWFGPVRASWPRDQPAGSVCSRFNNSRMPAGIYDLWVYHNGAGNLTDITWNPIWDNFSLTLLPTRAELDVVLPDVEWPFTIALRFRALAMNGGLLVPGLFLDPNILGDLTDRMHSLLIAFDEPSGHMMSGFWLDGIWHDHRPYAGDEDAISRVDGLTALGRSLYGHQAAADVRHFAVYDHTLTDDERVAVLAGLAR